MVCVLSTRSVSWADVLRPALLVGGTSIIWLLGLGLSSVQLHRLLRGVVGVEPRGCGSGGQAHCWVLRDRVIGFSVGPGWRRVVACRAWVPPVS